MMKLHKYYINTLDTMVKAYTHTHTHDGFDPVRYSTSSTPQKIMSYQHAVVFVWFVSFVFVMARQ